MQLFQDPTDLRDPLRLLCLNSIHMCWCHGLSVVQSTTFIASCIGYHGKRPSHIKHLCIHTSFYNSDSHLIKYLIYYDGTTNVSKATSSTFPTWFVSSQHVLVSWTNPSTRSIIVYAPDSLTRPWPPLIGYCQTERAVIGRSARIGSVCQ